MRPVQALYYVGGAIAAFSIGFLAERFGRKWAIAVVSTCTSKILLAFPLRGRITYLEGASLPSSHSSRVQYSQAQPTFLFSSSSGSSAAQAATCYPLRYQFGWQRSCLPGIEEHLSICMVHRIFLDTCLLRKISDQCLSLSCADYEQMGWVWLLLHNLFYKECVEGPVRYVTGLLTYYASSMNYVYMPPPCEQADKLIALQCLPPIVLLSMIYWLPESPRWLLMNDRYEDARKILLKLHNPEEAAQELLEIDAQMRIDKTLDTSYWNMLRKPSYRKRLLLTMCTTGFNQFSGILVITSMAPPQSAETSQIGYTNIGCVRLRPNHIQKSWLRHINPASLPMCMADT